LPAKRNLLLRVPVITRRPEMDLDRVVTIIDKHRSTRGGLMAILDEVQAGYGYLPAEALRAVAARTGRSLVDIYGVATFYKSFSLTPRGKHICSVCVGTACHVRGSTAVADELEKQLAVAPGGTTADGELTLETVNCLGACALGPIVVVDGRYFSNVSAAKVRDVLEQGQSGVQCAGESEAGPFPVRVRCPRCNHGLTDDGHRLLGHPAIRLLATSGERTERLWLSGLYGAHAADSDQQLRDGVLLRFHCPHCCAELKGISTCHRCEAPFVPLLVEGGAILQVCSRFGCPGQALDVSGMNA
jgi:NADH:ubiquinone oxidoreductase subunit E